MRCAGRGALRVHSAESPSPQLPGPSRRGRVTRGMLSSQEQQRQAQLGWHSAFPVHTGHPAMSWAGLPASLPVTLSGGAIEIRVPMGGVITTSPAPLLGSSGS